ncbi:MAG: hypothetical protein BroJett038_24280 [Chloroflexota bacterium]|nr:MAG: hypothetical protein BroJett038_24280 [Chloroflexota bacterium]
MTQEELRGELVNTLKALHDWQAQMGGFHALAWRKLDGLLKADACDSAPFPGLADCLRGLVEWEVNGGTWDAPCWAHARLLHAHLDALELIGKMGEAVDACKKIEGAYLYGHDNGSDVEWDHVDEARDMASEALRNLGYRGYSVSVLAEFEDGRRVPVGEAVVVALCEEEAKLAAFNRLWDGDLDRGHARAVIQCELHEEYADMARKVAGARV